MKKTLFALSIFTFAYAGVHAQKKLVPVQEKQEAAAQASTTIKFKSETHDFGTLKEGDPAETEFTFKNTGKEPLIIQNAKASCGCTVPYWPKEPIEPGKSESIKVSYNTKGRPGPINKAITVTSTAGTTVLHIKGNVEKAPTASVPQNGSMMKSK